MKVAFYLNCVSAHQLPLAKEVAELVGPENFCYVAAGEKGQEYQSADVSRFQGFKVSRLDEGREWIETADVMLTGMRDLELFERRAKRGLRTYYTSERWFKPWGIVRLFGLFDCSIGGWVRMFVPGYRRIVKRFVKWANEDPGARVLAIGPWAKKDFLRMGVRADRIVDWGYFVAPGAGEGVGGRRRRTMDGDVFKILWCGRMLDWKRAETVIRAANEFKVKGLKFKVTLAGDGPEKGRLIRLAQRLFPDDVAIEQSNNPNNRTILFLPSQPMEKVRELMREHDLFVLSSNGYEGWGAVVSEALEEGMRVLGTFEAGASATLLSRERLFHSGDRKALAQLIEKDSRGELPPCSIGEWTAKAAAERFQGLKVARALVYYGSFTEKIGGSEYLVFTIIRTLQAQYDVTLALDRFRVPPDEACKNYGIEVDWGRVNLVDLSPRGLFAKIDRHLKFARMRRLRRLGRDYDVCISCSNPVDFGRPGIHFVYMMNFDRMFQSWAQKWQMTAGKTIRHNLIYWRDGLSYVLSGARTPRQIVRDPREIVLPNSEYVRGMIDAFYGSHVHAAFYPPTTFETNLRNGSRRIDIGFIGRIEGEKRVADLVGIVRAARRRTGLDLQFHVAGVVLDDAYGRVMRSLAAENDWLHLHGGVTDEEKGRFLSSVAIALHGRRAEEFGISITEYLKAGVVPVVPNEGGAHEVLDNVELGYGKDGDAVGILVRLIEDDAFYRKSAERCRVRAKDFSAQAYWDRQSALLQELGVLGKT